MKKFRDCLIILLIFVSLVSFIPTNEASYLLHSYILNIKINSLNLKVEEKKLEETLNKVEEIVDPCLPRTLEQLEGKKLIAFTFDDGPNNKTTLRLIEGMQKYNARATFFVVGNRLNKHKDALIKTYETCNQIGNHTYNHYSLKKKSTDVVIDEINKTSIAINDIIGEYPTIIRYPYGSSNEKIRKIGNLPTIYWSIDTLDWKYRDENRIAKEIIDNAKDGEIILLHDLYETSVDGALMAMEYLSDEYAFVTIEELALIKQIELDSTKVYRKII